MVTVLAHAKAEHLGRPLLRICVRDARPRWGSCSGRSLVQLAADPGAARRARLRVAHEVAHRAAPVRARVLANRSNLTEHMDAGRTWLRRHGRELFRRPLRPRQACRPRRGRRVTQRNQGFLRASLGAGVSSPAMVRFKASADGKKQSRRHGSDAGFAPAYMKLLDTGELKERSSGGAFDRGNVRAQAW